MAQDWGHDERRSCQGKRVYRVVDHVLGVTNHAVAPSVRSMAFRRTSSLAAFRARERASGS